MSDDMMPPAHPAHRDGGNSPDGRPHPLLAVLVALGCSVTIGVMDNWQDGVTIMLAVLSTFRAAWGRSDE
ncbi:hypothetical protein IU500_17470 [Nocardia terpenica]|uniref:hypothetical protein n=1 Tax=Nocardia terpenica TaxID=455432 RepID=UPI0018956BC3|nr:hypothetical protein [Nocardia terpenica]MBF6063275.1 hypothetical protein [Nocardia terpenica]MBF6105831.1 hypothetical protein [Nocardia terpenica]MBF6113585.1 hypothetical protein [Nocardia terpenica]MBF6119572.1 hypothetical protein [Nocardia terpenica]MBF6151983.1 hypothetical protein [Nocardia terpenica]